MKSLKANLLVASPQLGDPNFARSVTILFEHSSEGAAGFILNRPTEKTLAELPVFELDEADVWNRAIYLGGPVPGPLIAIHGNMALSDQMVLEGVYLTADSEKLQELVRERVDPAVFIANYAGWGPGQLESELHEDSWLVQPGGAELVFWKNAKDHWEELVGQIRFRSLAETLNIRAVPQDPTLN